MDNAFARRTAKMDGTLWRISVPKGWHERETVRALVGSRIKLEVGSTAVVTEVESFDGPPSRPTALVDVNLSSFRAA